LKWARGFAEETRGFGADVSQNLIPCAKVLDVDSALDPAIEILPPVKN
jgi:hypothetical protein